jgi:hypothetical protein
MRDKIAIILIKLARKITTQGFADDHLAAAHTYLEGVRDGY